MKRKERLTYDPFNYNDSITVYYELPWKKDVIKPGDRIKFKNVRGTYIFVKWVHNSELDKTWIDCRAVTKIKEGFELNEYRSFYIDELKLVIRPKKSIRKKLV